MGILGFGKGRNKVSRLAFQGKMACPFCSRSADPTTSPMGFETTKTKIRLKENLGPFIKVYKCGICNGEWRYDINQEKTDPYSSFTRGLKKDISLPGLNYKGRVPIIKK